MTLDLYELRFQRQGIDVRGVAPAHERLDLADLEGTFALLDRHLMAVCDYAGEQRRNAHLFEVAVYPMDRDMRPERNPVLRRRLPVDPLEVPRWR